MKFSGSETLMQFKTVHFTVAMMFFFYQTNGPKGTDTYKNGTNLPIKKREKITKTTFYRRVMGLYRVFFSV